MKLWLSPEVLGWNTDVLGLRTSQATDFLKPYELLKHAKKRLDQVDDSNPDQENPVLGEVVYHLRRAIEHREKQLDKNFNLSELPFEEFPSKKNPRTEERLYELGVIRPILRSKLNRHRNIITHEQKDPYSKAKSEITELFEFTWYFIRSTDSFLGRQISGIVLYPPDSSDVKHVDDSEFDGCFLINFRPMHKWQVDIEGYRVPISLFSKNEKEHWFQLIVNHFDDFAVDEELGLNIYDQIFAHPFEEIPSDIMDAGREKRFDKYSLSSDDIKHFKGTLTGPPTALRFMIEGYFELYMFY